MPVSPKIGNAEKIQGDLRIPRRILHRMGHISRFEMEFWEFDKHFSLFDINRYQKNGFLAVTF